MVHFANLFILHGLPNCKIFGIQRFSLRESLIITYLAIINVSQAFLDTCAKFLYFSWFSLHDRLYTILERFFLSQKNHQNERKTAKFHLPIGNFSRKIDWWRYFGLFSYRFWSKMPFFVFYAKIDQKKSIFRSKNDFFRKFFDNNV